MKHLFINRNTYVLNTFTVLYCDDGNNHLEDSDDNDDVDVDDDNKLVRSYTSYNTFTTIVNIDAENSLCVIERETLKYKPTSAILTVLGTTIV